MPKKKKKKKEKKKKMMSAGLRTTSYHGSKLHGHKYKTQ